MKNDPVIILLATYNGEKYLKKQLESLHNQTYKNFEIIARDDGSSDNTVEILKAYNINILDTKENLGAKGSFSLLLDYAVKNRDAQYFMFCDQDDVWNDDKIEKTLAKMKKMEKEFGNIPILVHTDLEVVDKNLKTIADSMWEYEHILPQCNSFNRLLIQNTITGCTMMINRKLALKSLDIPNEAIMHDWWIGLIASSFGKIGYLNHITIKYRQHGKNTIGAKGHKINILRHILGLLLSTIKRNNEYITHMQINISQAKAFLKIFKQELDENIKKLLIDFSLIEQKSLLDKRKVLIKYKLLKQGLIRNIGLFIKI